MSKLNKQFDLHITDKNLHISSLSDYILAYVIILLSLARRCPLAQLQLDGKDNDRRPSSYNCQQDCKRSAKGVPFLWVKNPMIVVAVVPVVVVMGILCC